MLIYDEIFSWDGFGGRFHLAAGSCRLRIIDLSQGKDKKVTHLKPKVVVVSDLPDDSPKMKKVSVRSCSSHIATCIVEKFNLDPHRIVFVEYYPGSTYGDHNQYIITPKYELVEFDWHENKALHPKWQTLGRSLREIVAPMIESIK